MRSVAIGLVVLDLCASACSSGGRSRAATTTTRASRSSHSAIVRVEPLLGVATTGPMRASLTVEINHTADSPPFNGPITGVDRADVIYEYVVEGGITRLVAVFNSNVPDRIGPIRSVRRTEASIVSPLGGVFAFSGGAQYALNSIDAAPVVRVDEGSAGAGMFRDPKGYPPNNLYGNGSRLLAKAPHARPPQPLFSYRQPRTNVLGRAVSSFVVGFQAGYAITWTWDPREATWTRQAFGGPERTSDGVLLGAKNVVVMFVAYAGGVGVQGAQAQLIGHGNAWVFTAGKFVAGEWSRSRSTQPGQLFDIHGHTIGLTPGQTWVELFPPSYTVTLSPRSPNS
jgi:hypothetical protein